MRLYLIRHAEAEDPPSDELDPQRRLTARGRRQAERAAAFLGRLDLKLEAIWHSPLVRAVRTAGILAKSVASRQGRIKRRGIAPLDPVGPVAKELAKTEADLMIVGHEPFLSRLAGRLVAGTVAFGNAGPVCLERSAKGTWKVRWAMPPEVLEQLRLRRKERKHVQV